MVIFTAIDNLSTSYRIKYCMSVVVSLVCISKRELKTRKIRVSKCLSLFNLFAAELNPDIQTRA